MKFKVGDKVKHKDFGVGEIIYIDEEMTAMPYAVQFKIFNNEYWCEEGNLELDKEHNPIPQIAKMLGVEIGERFKVDNVSGTFYFENYCLLEEGLSNFIFDNEQIRLNAILLELINGNWKIEKLPKKPILTEDEKVILENLTKEYKYVARDYCGTLYVYKNKPKKDGDSWWIYGLNNLSLFQRLFQFIKWEDKEAYNIKELLKGE